MEGSDLEETFNRAANHVHKLVASLSQDQMLVLYGLYKQATIGSNNTSKPSFIQVAHRRKWEAWTAHKNKSHKKAMVEYIATVEQYDPEFCADKATDSTGAGDTWVHVSSLAGEETPIPDSEKTLFDWVKENNEGRVRECLKSGMDLKALDDTGMSVLHWASDRGHVAMVKLLLDAGVDPNCRDSDGQTPLHYAASCGHADVARALLTFGADAGAVDDDGCSPPDLDILLDKN